MGSNYLEALDFLHKACVLHFFNNLGYDKNAGDKYFHPNILQLRKSQLILYAMLTRLHEIEKKPLDFVFIATINDYNFIVS